MAHLTIRDILPWLRSVVPGVSFYNSFVDLSLPSVVGVYKRPNGRMQPQAIGGQSSYGTTSITLLVRGTTNSGDSEAFANGIWDAVRGAGAEITLGTTTGWVTALKEPVFVDRDEKNIFEYVVDFDIHFNK